MTTETRVAPTPGPWIVYDDDDGDSLWIYAGDDCVAYIDGADIAAIGVETSRANGRLIAAAPDLLAACLDVLELITAPAPHPDDDTYGARMVEKSLRAAIAKATGA